MSRSIRFGVAAALLALLPAAVEAQVAAGFRGGIRNAGFSSSQSVSTISEVVYGAYIGFGLSDHLAFQTELVYGVRGGDGLKLGTDALDDTAGDVRLDMKYLEVPFLLRVGFPGRRLLASFFAGPYLGFLLSCDVDAAGVTTACDDTAATQRFHPRSTDLGATAGVGFDMALGESTLFIDARFSLGLLSIQSGSDPFDVRHNGLAITGGFAVPLGR